MALQRATVGFSPHSGWAAAVVLTGPVARPELIDRRRFLLAEPDDHVGKQPLHAAEEMPLAQATRLVDRCVADSRQRAVAELRGLASDLEKRGYTLAAGGLCGKEGRPLGSLAAILGSHALIHAAEGEVFRQVLRDAAADHRIAFADVLEREAEARCAKAVRLPVETVRSHLAAMGREAGPPWTKDQKLAALVAWGCLGGRRAPTRAPR
ncbi:MAG TPA: hypothetical protein VFQ51_06240 [Vicinamibacteria bacterium]|nr:hypothetical protein [Vicinamibacteria bacterium]